MQSQEQMFAKEEKTMDEEFARLIKKLTQEEKLEVLAYIRQLKNNK